MSALAILERAREIVEREGGFFYLDGARAGICRAINRGSHSLGFCIGSRNAAHGLMLFGQGFPILLAAHRRIRRRTLHRTVLSDRYGEDGGFVNRDVEARGVDGRFLKGINASPSTQIRRGERKSVATEFRKGQIARNRLQLGSVRVRIETHTGLARAWVKIAEPNVWQKRAIVEWERANGPLPRGYVVHHRDRDSMNDALDNLVALTRKDHADEHRGELLAARGTA